MELFLSNPRLFPDTFSYFLGDRPFTVGFSHCLLARFLAIAHFFLTF